MKQQRQFKIKEIITMERISSQEDLLERLTTHGYDTTQATLSRDLHEIGIIRVPDEKGFRYIFHKEENPQAVRDLISMEIINVLANESIVIVKTMPGRAQGVAIFLDRLKNTRIIGTIAGDDCIMIIPDSHDNVQELVEYVRSVMNKKTL